MKRRLKKRPAPGRFAMVAGFLHRWGVMLSVVALSLAAVLWGYQWLQQPGAMPLRSVGIDGEVRYLDRGLLEKTVHESIRGGFFSVDLQAVRSAVEGLPWVDRVSVKRLWPDRIEVSVVEHEPLARWGKDALVNQRGEIFRPRSLPKIPGLVSWEGPDANVALIHRNYRRIRALLETVEMKLKRIVADQRNAWTLYTDEGLALVLGRGDAAQQLARFVPLYPELRASRKQKLLRIDLRYTNGFSVTWETQMDHSESANYPQMLFRPNRGVDV
ncbi:cell division protein FtsQ [Candidatus Endoriftia persephone str. Guaymas]|nr:cell division protein FtsQ [Candidatus Endoriftia persephone str. Guaymas]